MPRYHVASVPFLLIALVRGFERTKRGALLLAIVFAGMLFSDVELLRGREHHFLFPLHPWREAEALVRARPAPVVAPPGPFRFLYVPDLAIGTETGVAPTGSSCWLLVDEHTSEALEEEWLAALAKHGFKKTEERTLLEDPDHEARERWIGRGTRPRPVRLLLLGR